MKIKYFEPSFFGSLEKRVNEFLANPDITVLNFDWKATIFGSFVMIQYEDKIPK